MAQRKGTREWTPWLLFLDNGNVTCVFCDTTTQYKRTRALMHFGYRPNTERCVCRNVPLNVRNAFANCGGLVPARMSHADMYAGVSIYEEGPSKTAPSGSSTHILSDIQGGGAVSAVRSASPITAASDSQHPMSQQPAGSNSTRSVAARQRGMEESLNIAKRKELDEKWADCFYNANIPFNVARNPFFIEAVLATSKARFDYVPPSYHQFRTNLLEPSRQRVEQKIEQKIGFAKKTYGVSICTDGWDDVNRRPLMNVMMTCPTGDVFLGSIDTTGQTKSATYIADELKVFIEKVGPEHVTTVCTDNAANMLGAMRGIVDEYPWIFSQGCMAHALDLLLEDWAKIREFKDLIERARKLCHYIRNHHATMSTFRELSPKLSLVVPTETRFACNMLMLDRLVKLKPVLEQLKDHPRVQTYFGNLRNRMGGEQAATNSRNVVRTIEDVGFWQRCKNFIHMTEDVLKALREFDGRNPCMGKAWLIMHRLRQHVHSLRGPPFSLRPDIATVMEDSFNDRRAMCFTDLHYAAAYLNPYLKDQPALKQDGTALRALYRVFHKLTGVLGVEFDDLLSELQEYEEGTGPYSADMTPSIREGNMLPHQWWNRVGDRALSKVAMRILSLTCSASSCERNWSAYSFVHNKSRNRLAPAKAETLVYIYSNSRVLRKRPGADAVRWYEDNVYSEDSDPDALGPVPVGEPNREFNAVDVEEDDENDMEENGVGEEYPPNPDLWAEGADNLDRAREYYGDDDAMDDDHEPIGWGQGPWSASPPRRTPSPRNRPYVGKGKAPMEEPTSGNGDPDLEPNRDVDRTLPVDDVNQNIPSSENYGANGDDQNEGEVGTIGSIEPVLPVIHDAFEFTDDVEHGHGEIPVPTAVSGLNTPTPQVPTPNSPATSNASGGASQSEGFHGRPPIVPRPPIHYPMGQYQQARGRNGGTRRGGTSSRGGNRKGPKPGRHDGEASSSMPSRRCSSGIGVRDPNTVIEPFLDTYVPGRTSSTPAYKVPPGPALNSDGEYPDAKRHKVLRVEENLYGRKIALLRNESTCSSSGSDDEADIERGSNNDDDGDPCCDEAPDDDDVVIGNANMAGTSTQGVRRSSRFNK